MLTNTMEANDLFDAQQNDAVKGEETKLDEPKDSSLEQGHSPATLAGRRQVQKARLGRIDKGSSKKSGEEIVVPQESVDDGVDSAGGRREGKDLRVVNSSVGDGLGNNEEQPSSGNSSILPGEDNIDFVNRRGLGGSDSDFPIDDIIKRRNCRAQNTAHRLDRIENPDPSPKPLTASSDLRTTLAELRVKHRLFPAMILFSYPSILLSDRREIHNAADHAIAAWRIARQYHVSLALQARCAYYVALGEYLLSDKDEYGRPRARSAPSSPESAGSLGGEVEKTACVQYFKQACAARDVYVEGELAEQWLNYFRSTRLSPDGDGEGGVRGRSSSAGSWITGLWSRVFGAKNGAPVSPPIEDAPAFKVPPRMIKGGRKAKREADMAGDDESAAKPEAIPEFTSWGSGTQSQGVESKPEVEEVIEDDEDEQDLPNSVLGGNISIKDFQPPSTPPTSPPLSQPERKKTYRITNPDPASASSGTSSNSKSKDGVDGKGNPSSSPRPPINPRYAPLSPSPTHSPTSSNSAVSSARSISFSTDSKDAKSPSPKKPGYTHRRKSSLLSLVTGRERQPSELELMEEGDSPYRENFDGDGDSGGGTGLKKRKAGVPEDIV